MAVDPVSIPAPVRAALGAAAQATGADFAELAETARRESAFRTDARAKTSSAAGLFQFVEATWLDMVKKHGAAHGLGDLADKIDLRSGKPHVADAATRKAILDLRYDPEISARMAAELAHDNAASLTGSLGRPPTRNEIYAAHVFGARGAATLIKAAESGHANAASLLPRAAAANAGLFYAAGKPRSPADLLDLLGGFDAAPANAPATEPAQTLVAANPTGAVENFIAASIRGLLSDAPSSGDGDIQRALLATIAYRRNTR